MKKPSLPRTDSIHELAEFRDSHDLIEFETWRFPDPDSAPPLRPPDGQSAMCQPEGVPLRLDADAESADSSLPAFIARPAGAPVYAGFPLLEASRTADGWHFGTISDPACPDGLEWGDAFVVAPDGSRAGSYGKSGRRCSKSAFYRKRLAGGSTTSGSRIQCITTKSW
jgi:hypothetical protein